MMIKKMSLTLVALFILIGPPIPTRAANDQTPPNPARGALVVPAAGDSTADTPHLGEMGVDLINDDLLAELPSPEDLLDGPSNATPAHVKPKIKVGIESLLSATTSLTPTDSINSEERFKKLEELIGKVEEKREKMWNVYRPQSVDELVQMNDEYSTLREVLKGLFHCSADLIESGYGVDSGGTPISIIKGASYLQMASIIKSAWDAQSSLENEKRLKKGSEYPIDQRSISSHIPQGILFNFLKVSELCQDYLSTLKKSNLRKSRLPNTQMLEELIRPEGILEKDYGINPEIIKMVEYAQGEPTEELKFRGRAVCIQPKIHSMATPPMKFFKLALRCVTPLGRVADFESGYQLKFVPGFLFQIGQSSDSEFIEAPIPVHDLNEDFEKRYHFREKVIFGFAEVSLVKEVKEMPKKKGDDNGEDFRPAGEIRFGDDLDDSVNDKGRFKTWEKILVRSRRFGGLGYIGFADMKLKAKLFERKSLYAPMDEDLAHFTRDEGNIPKILGFKNFYWSAEGIAHEPQR